MCTIYDLARRGDPAHLTGIVKRVIHYIDMFLRLLMPR